MHKVPDSITVQPGFVKPIRQPRQPGSGRLPLAPLFLRGSFKPQVRHTSGSRVRAPDWLGLSSLPLIRHHLHAGVDEEDVARDAAAQVARQEDSGVGHLGRIGVSAQRSALGNGLQNA